jgi:parallel beta helix pectate lyase-like protein
MNYTFKLSRRLARLRTVSIVVVATLLSLSCNGDDPSGPGSVPANDPRVSVSPHAVSIGVHQAMQFQVSQSSTDSSSTSLYSASKGGKGRGRMRREVISLAVAPHTLTVAEGSATTFTATATMADSSTMELSVTWAATGGTIDANGRYTAGQTPGNYVVTATASNGAADTAAVVITENLPIVTDISLSPTSASLPVGGSKQFVAVGKASDGTTVAVSSKYAATGGSISSQGVYQAGQLAGTFQVIATDTVDNLADTSSVIIEPPPVTLQAVVLSPATASLTMGATQQFAASGRMSDGSTTTVNITYSATGGTITSSGNYTAGSVAGSYRVIATQTGGTLADTSTVSVTTPLSSPSSCLRTVPVSTMDGLTAALSAALPGDCILMVAGTYSVTVASPHSLGLSITKSGTAANPIVIQGAGSSTVLDLNLRMMDLRGSYVQLRRFRITDFPGMGLWLRGVTGVVLDSMEIDHTNQEAIKIVEGSHHNVIKNSHIHDTGIVEPQWGEGIYVGNSGYPGFPLDFGVTDNQILNNYFGPNLRSEGVDLKEGTDRTIVRGNTFDGTGTANTLDMGSGALMAVISSNNVIDGNTFKFGRPDGIDFYAPTTVTMVGNVVSNNTVDLQNILGVTRPYGTWGFWLTANTNSPSHVILKCNNTVINGTFSNVACTP